MKKLTVEIMIHEDHDAYDQFSSKLKDVAAYIDEWRDNHENKIIRDLNGNKAGHWSIVDVED